MAGLDSLFGIHAEALRVQQQRMSTLASNIANADTPGYQAKDIDFTKILARAVSDASAGNTSRSGADTAAGDLPLDGSAADTSNDIAGATVFRVPVQPSADGNTVDVQVEQAAFADSAMHYQASLSFIDNRLRSLMTAITGS
ncbi:MAG: flagellar basal body rod protein FlgB [Stenotrophobium sp.]